MRRIITGQYPAPGTAMKKIVFVLLLVLPWSIIRAKNAATLQLLTNPTGIAVKIYDNHFKLVSTLKRGNYTLRKILPEDKKKMHSVFKVVLKERYDVLRQRITFPETFAAIRNIIMDGGKLYIITFKKQEGGVECFLYTPEGTFIQKLHIPLISENILQYYPYTIHNGSLYQLIENEDTEEWELHVNGL